MLLNFRYAVGLLFFIPTLVIALPPSISRPLRAKSELHKERYESWLSGSLLAPNGHNLRRGELELKPFLYASDSVGTYSYIWQNRATNDVRTVNPVLTVGYGILDWLDVELTFQGYYKENMHKHAFRRGDIIGALGFQLLTQKPNTPKPDIRFIFMENFPWGFYQRLNPEKGGADSSGSGSWESSALFVLQKTFHTANVHFFNVELSLGYTHANRVEVTSFNTYGGGYGTDATVHPKGKWTGMVSLEYSITQNLAFALDMVGTIMQRGNVVGDLGIGQNGETATFNLDDNYQFSFAPALQWNFSKGVGLVGGVWMSLFDKEDKNFVSGVIGMNIRR